MLKNLNTIITAEIHFFVSVAIYFSIVFMSAFIIFCVIKIFVNNGFRSIDIGKIFLATAVVI